MLRALYSSAAGMEAQQTNLDVISNNLANVSTTGYKKSQAEFEDLLYDTRSSAGAQSGGGNVLPTGVQVGHGSRLVATPKVFTTGELSQTQGQLDVAIQGDGFFQVLMPDGTLAYTRAGSLKEGSDGRVMTSDGLPLQGGWQSIPTGTTSINISPSGLVTTVGASGTQSFQVNLYRFTNPAGLQSLGRNLYKDTQASGQAESGTPGQGGFGQLQQGFIELSNVSVVEEMVKMIMAQRAYEVNSKAVQASDEMMQMSNNLRH
jgi:flagellar basal-body rod protein FlgG